MVSCHLHLDKTTTLFKTLKKKGFLNWHDNTLHMYIVIKPNIGELIHLHSVNVDNKELRNYLDHRGRVKEKICLRVKDLIYYNIIDGEFNTPIIHIKVEEEYISDWYN